MAGEPETTRFGAEARTTAGRGEGFGEMDPEADAEAGDGGDG